MTDQTPTAPASEAGNNSALDIEELMVADYGKGGAIPPVPVQCDADRFENIVREFGVTFCCEWFGHHADSDFTRETIAILRERSARNNQQG